MAQPGEVIEHPSFGTRIKFLQTAEQTSGELLRVEVTLPPGFSMPEHVQPPAGGLPTASTRARG